MHHYIAINLGSLGRQPSRLILMIQVSLASSCYCKKYIWCVPSSYENVNLQNYFTKEFRFFSVLIHSYAFYFPWYILCLMEKSDEMVLIIFWCFVSNYMSRVAPWYILYRLSMFEIKFHLSSFIEITFKLKYLCASFIDHAHHRIGKPQRVSDIQHPLSYTLKKSISKTRYFTTKKITVIWF